jgi:hypothetical protein
VIAAEGRCRARSEAALAWIEQQSEVDTVLLGFYGHYFESTDVAQAHRDNPVGPAGTRIDGSLNREKKRAAFARGLERTVRRLTAAGKTVVVVIDVPELTVAPQNCFTTPRVPLKQQTCSVPMEQVRARQKALRQIVLNLAWKYPSVRIVDPVPVLCNETACGPGTMDALTYRDSHHLSAYGSRLVAAQIVRSVNSQ